MNKKTFFWVACAVCVTALCCLLAFLAWYFISGRSKYDISSKDELKDIVISQTYPAQVALGEEFPFEISITNTAKEPQVLDSIDFAETYMAGIAVTQTTPETKWIRQSDSRFPFNSYQFNKEIPANGTLVVTFVMRAVTAGRSIGTVFICVNNPTLCNFYVIKTQVQSGKF
jgi:hypothetical protein